MAYALTRTDRLPLRILLDGRKLGDGGIGIYIQNLVDGLLQERASGFPLNITMIASDVLSGESEKIINGWKNKINIVQDGAKKYSSDEYLMMPRRLKSVIEANDLFHSPHYTLPAGFRKSSVNPFRKKSIPSVVTIHDAIHLTAPENFSQRMFGSLLIRSAVRRADHIVTVSAASLSRLSRIFPGVAISVVPNALAKGIGLKSLEDVQTVISKYELIQPYIMFVGSDRPHKGFVEFVNALSQIEDYKPMVVVVGERFSVSAKLYAVEKLGAQRFRFVGGINQTDLAALYNGTRAVVVPSKIEGFGLVALEALAAGAPLVCSPEQSLRELAGNCGWYAESFSPTDLAEAIQRCFLERELAEEKAAAGIIRAKEFTCERVAAEHLQVYLSVLSPERASVFYEHGEDKLSYPATHAARLEPEMIFTPPVNIPLSTDELLSPTPTTENSEFSPPSSASSLYQ